MCGWNSRLSADIRVTLLVNHPPRRGVVVLRNWIAFGAYMGALSSVQVLASEASIISVAVCIGFGILLGLAGGTVKLLLGRPSENHSRSWPRHDTVELLLRVLLVLLVIITLMAGATSRASVLSIALLVATTAVFVGIQLYRKYK